MEIESSSIGIIEGNGTPSIWATKLKVSLEKRGIKVYQEFDDGYKHIDLALPKARINIEVDGIQHLTNPKQILADLGRGFYSHKLGYDTMHIPNLLLSKHLEEIADALALAAKDRQKKLWLHFD